MIQINPGPGYFSMLFAFLGRNLRALGWATCAFLVGGWGFELLRFSGSNYLSEGLSSNFMIGVQEFSAHNYFIRNDLLFWFASALIYALIFEIYFWIARFSASALSRTEKLWSYVAPGLSLFFLLGEPMANQVRVHFLGTSPFAMSGYVIAAVACLAIAPILIYLWPRLRGANWTFVFFSAMGAAVLNYPILGASGAILDPIVYLISSLIFSSFLYALLQIRFRFALSPNYDRAIIPWKALFIAALILVLFLLFGIARISLITQNYYAEISGILSAINLMAYLAPVVLSQWLIFGLVIRGSRLLRERKRMLIALQKGSLAMTALVLLFSGYALGISIARNDSFDKDLARRYRQRGGMAYELLSLPSLIKNLNEAYASRIRFTELSAAVRARPESIRIAKQEVALQNSAEDSGEKIANGRDVIVFSLVHESPRSKILRRMGSEFDFKRHKVFFKRDGLEAGLKWGRADLTQDANANASANARRSSSVISLPGLFAREGYRTICIGHDGGSGYFSVSHAWRLDKGCQVFINIGPQNLKNPVRNHKLDLDQFLRKAKKIAKRYAEKKTFIWLHYDLEDGRNHNRLLHLPRNRSESVEPVHLVFSFLAKHKYAQSALLLLHGGKPIDGDILSEISGDATKRKTNHSPPPQREGKKFADKIFKQVPGFGRARYRNRFSWSLAYHARMFAFLPIIRYKGKEDRVLFFDEFTAIEYSKPFF